jgi:hypothetical protein
MFLVHAARVVNVCVDFADVVEITNRYLGYKINKMAFALPVRNALRSRDSEIPELYAEKCETDLHFCHLLKLVE